MFDAIKMRLNKLRYDWLRVLGFVSVAILSSILLGDQVSKGMWQVPVIGLAMLYFVLIVFNIDLKFVISIWLFVAIGMQWWGGFEMGYRIPNITIDRFFLFSGVAIILLRRERFRSLGKSSILVLWMSAFYALYVLILIIIRADDFNTELLGWISTLVFPVFALFIALHIQVDHSWWLKIQNGIRIIVLYLFIPALIEYVRQSPLLPSAWVMNISTDVQGIRVASLAGAPTNLSYTTMFLLPFTIYPFAIVRSKWQRLFDTFIFGANLVTMFLCGYRVTWVVSIISLILAFVLIPRIRKYILLLFVCLGFVWIIFNKQIISSNYVQYRVLDLTNINFRIDTFRFQIQKVSENVLVGVGGTSAYNVYFNSQMLSSHNTYTSILLYSGVIGLLFQFGIWGVFIYGVLDIWKKRGFVSKRMVILCILFLGIIGSLIYGLSGDTRAFITINYLFGFTIGLGINIIETLNLEKTFSPYLRGHNDEQSA